MSAATLALYGHGPGGDEYDVVLMVIAVILLIVIVNP
jgi:hypothetical protein